MTAPSPGELFPHSTILAADRVPWLGVGRPAMIIDTDPKHPKAVKATVDAINPRRIVTKGQRRFLQSRMVEIPSGSGHYGYRAFQSPDVLVGPDNPHIAMITNYVARTKLLKKLKDGWSELWLSRNDDGAMRQAAAAMITILDDYLKETGK